MTTPPGAGERRPPPKDKHHDNLRGAPSHSLRKQLSICPYGAARGEPGPRARAIGGARGARVRRLRVPLLAAGVSRDSKPRAPPRPPAAFCLSAFSLDRNPPVCPRRRRGRGGG